MLSEVIKIMFFSTIGTVLLILPIMLIPIAIIIIAFGAKHKGKNNKEEN